MSMCLSIYLVVCVRACVWRCLSVLYLCLSGRLPLSIYGSHLSVHLSVCVCVCLALDRLNTSIQSVSIHCSLFTPFSNQANGLFSSQRLLFNHFISLFSHLFYASILPLHSHPPHSHSPSHYTTPH